MTKKQLKQTIKNLKKELEIANDITDKALKGRWKAYERIKYLETLTMHKIEVKMQKEYSDTITSLQNARDVAEFKLEQLMVKR